MELYSTREKVVHIGFFLSLILLLLNLSLSLSQTDIPIPNRIIVGQWIQDNILPSTNNNMSFSNTNVSTSPHTNYRVTAPGIITLLEGHTDANTTGGTISFEIYKNLAATGYKATIPVGDRNTPLEIPNLSVDTNDLIGIRVTSTSTLTSVALDPTVFIEITALY